MGTVNSNNDIAPVSITEITETKVVIKMELASVMPFNKL